MIFDYNFPGAAQLGFAYIWSAGQEIIPPVAHAGSLILQGIRAGSAEILGG